jgi:hypothetical protein
MKRPFWTSFEFTPISVRSISPPCEGGVRGGGPGETMAWYAGPELLDRAELPAWPSMFVMPCPPPLAPPSQGGKGLARSHCHSIARTKSTRLETVPRARPTVSFRHPRFPDGNGYPVMAQEMTTKE